MLDLQIKGYEPIIPNNIFGRRLSSETGTPNGLAETVIISTCYLPTRNNVLEWFKDAAKKSLLQDYKPHQLPNGAIVARDFAEVVGNLPREARERIAEMREDVRDYILQILTACPEDVADRQRLGISAATMRNNTYRRIQNATVPNKTKIVREAEKLGGWNLSTILRDGSVSNNSAIEVHGRTPDGPADPTYEQRVAANHTFDLVKDQLRDGELVAKLEDVTHKWGLYSLSMHLAHSLWEQMIEDKIIMGQVPDIRRGNISEILKEYGQ